MAIDTLGFSIATTAELDGAKRELKSDIGQLKSDLAGTEASLSAAIAKLEATLTLRTIAIAGALDAVLFALLKFA
jgi:hypothetical protein